MGLRLLHTADWHLGHTIHGVERDFEHCSFVEWLRIGVQVLVEPIGIGRSRVVGPAPC